jgi:hypothetical protein
MKHWPRRAIDLSADYTDYAGSTETVRDLEKLLQVVLFESV